jgi:hypothetical protein
MEAARHASHTCGDIRVSLTTATIRDIAGCLVIGMVLVIGAVVFAPQR